LGKAARSSYFDAMTIQKPIPFVVYRQGTGPEPPAELGVHGSKLWRDTLSEFDISDAPRLMILEQAGFALDRANSLRRQIAVSGEEVETGNGSTKANPLIMAELQARGLVARLLGRLNLNNEPKRGPGRPPNKGRG
jgi:hypothetical protein